ncbi:hypothetical protein IFT66_14675 [Rhizobium sp. CFBP 13726]|uniref:hypothetical protein n=1 Tax=Rhizobium sp. CFBP 13726 TaxID=2775296 RepID=UPI001781CC51|nr:hypothetical protein [Rhizobium sp. CFBP 13726]MBD8652330.1 hypothetical protein [Rhizobium sp. CFBP 13726]
MTHKIQSQTDEQKALCDRLITGAAHMMVDDAGVPVPLMLDRILTFAAAQSCANEGKARTAAAFRDLAARIEAGALDRKGLQ